MPYFISSLQTTGKVLSALGLSAPQPEHRSSLLRAEAFMLNSHAVFSSS